MMIFLVLVILVYAVTIAQLVYGFGKIKTHVPTQKSPKTFFSIVVPFRNEKENLPSLLESLRKLNYPIDLFEMILIDDFSEDHSQRIVYDWRMQNGEYDVTLLENIKVSGSPKKDAIARAVPIAKQDWIVTTDADCTFPENWLLTLDHYLQENEVSMLVGAVTYESGHSFIRNFQQLDLASLQGATIGSFGLGLGFMCNGANFAYKKSLFFELGGFGGNQDKATGDDVFLLQKAVAKHPDKVHYLKAQTNIVTTKPLKNWRQLFQQRVRWASKTGAYQSVFGKDLALIVLLGNLCCLVALGFSIFEKISWIEFAIIFSIKFIIDTILLYKAEKFLNGKSLFWLMPSMALYPFFSVGVALYSLVFGYSWKGRKFRS